MKKSIKRFSSFLLVLCMCTNILLIPVSATISSSAYIDSYRAWLIAGHDGLISVAVDVQATGYMDEVGASKIELYESSDGGETWERVRIFLRSLYPGMTLEDEVLYYQIAATYDGVPGRLYCAIVTVYAGDSTGYDTRDYTTPTMMAKN